MEGATGSAAYRPVWPLRDDPPPDIILAICFRTEIALDGFSKCCGLPNKRTQLALLSGTCCSADPIWIGKPLAGAEGHTPRHLVAKTPSPTPPEDALQEALLLQERRRRLRDHQLRPARLQRQQRELGAGLDFRQKDATRVMSISICLYRSISILLYLSLSLYLSISLSLYIYIYMYLSVSLHLFAYESPGPATHKGNPGKVLRMTRARRPWPEDRQTTYQTCHLMLARCTHSTTCTSRTYCCNVVGTGCQPYDCAEGVEDSEHQEGGCRQGVVRF